MSIANGLDYNETQQTTRGTMLYGLYYYYLDNDILEKSKKSSIPLQLPSIQTLSFLPFFNHNEIGVLKAKIDKNYYKLPQTFADIDIYRLTVGRYSKTLPSFNIQDRLNYYHEKNLPSGLLFYPYRYFLLSDGVNPPLMIKPQNLVGQNKITPIVETYITQNSKYKIYVKENKNDVNGELESIINNTSFLLPIGTNVYNNFMVTSGNTYQATNSLAFMENDKTFTQAKESLDLKSEKDMTTGVLGILGNIFNGNIISGLTGAFTGGVNLGYQKRQNDLTKNQLTENYNFNNYQIETRMLATKKDYLNTPRTMKTLGNDGVFNLNNTNGDLKIYEFRVNPEQEVRLSRYYKCYGYRVNKYSKPQFKNKKYFNFIKTQNCNIDSSVIPLEHIRQLEQIFNTGLTFWHVENDVEVGDYTVNNTDII